MKAVLISIMPLWCYKILNYLKLIEVRKNRPKLETPFKCYIYMSSGGWAWRDPFSTAVVPPNGEMYNGAQKVVAEFICDSIDEYRPDDSPFGVYDISDDVVQKTCLPDGQLWEYGKGKTLYGWHISDLKIYDKPKELSEFYTWKKCNSCRTSGYESSACIYDEDCKVPAIITRPPQSWCYVEEVA